MFAFFRGLSAFLGRVMLTVMFLMAAAYKIPNFDQMVGKMDQAGVPLPRIMLVVAIVFLIAGSLSIIIGFKAQMGACMLLIFLILATGFFHQFWALPEDAMQEELQNFMRNVALAGAMLLIIANGAGPWSIDSWKCKKQAAAEG